MTSKNTERDLDELFKTAADEGRISPAAAGVLAVVDLGAQIQAGLGVVAADVEASEVVLVTMMPDDSGSIRHAGNEGAVIDGHNEVLKALSDTKQRDSILAHTRYLNGTVLFPYRAILQATPMSPKNYAAIHGTPLYDQTVVLLGTVLAKSQELANAGVPSRTVTLLITDGADCGSTWAKASDVRTLVEDMVKGEGHIVAAMGIDDGQTAFRRAFREMGIEDRWILTPKSDKTEIRKAFQVFSQSAIKASQGGASFSKTAAGGFASP